MNWVCKPYLEKFVIVFIADILIYLNSKEDQEVHLEIVLELLKKEKLFAKFSKCEFSLQEVYFLGHVVNDNGINVDPSKIEAVKNSKKDQKYDRGVEQKETFQTLMDNLCNTPILLLPNRSEDFVGYYNASNQGFRCVLMQRGKRTCIELFSDYDCKIHYHSEKANVMADALSRKERVKPRRVRAMSMTIQSSIKDKILAAQSEMSKAENASTEMLYGLDQQMEKRNMVV
nr:hypothetical protein [Tanacetum cinerariifolium]